MSIAQQYLKDFIFGVSSYGTQAAYNFSGIVANAHNATKPREAMDLLNIHEDRELDGILRCYDWDVKVPVVTKEGYALYPRTLVEFLSQPHSSRAICTVPTFQKFDTPISTVGYDDGLGHRSRRSMLILYCANFAIKFTGEDIPGVCVITNSSYNKNGKWSSTSYNIELAAGFKASSITQSWEGGKFCDDVTSWKVIQSQLGLEGLNPSALKDFVAIFLPTTLARFNELAEKLAAIDDAVEESGVEWIEYKFASIYHTRRRGSTQLLLDGVVWNRNENEVVKILSERHESGRGGGDYFYTLMISTEVKIEELDEDELDQAGYTRNGFGDWSKASTASSGNNPFEGLSGMFK